MKRLMKFKYANASTIDSAINSTAKNNYVVLYKAAYNILRLKIVTDDLPLIARC